MIGRCVMGKQFPKRLLVIGRAMTLLLVLGVVYIVGIEHSEASASFEGVTDATSLVFRPFSSGFNAPLGIVNAGDERLFILEKVGVIRILNPDGTIQATPFLDIQSRVESGGNEQGLLGLVFHPSYTINGYFYINYIWKDTAGDFFTRISRFERSAGESNLADPASEVILLTVQQPDVNHNAGDLVFGPDGYLYIPLGDGGGGNTSNSQDGSTFLGKILQVDVDGADPYAIPDDNPFVGATGVEDEIWAMGLRNPWRISFDASTGDLYIADVGQLEWEEINVQSVSSTGGENYGWPCYEANHEYDPTGCGPIGDYEFPVAEYSHDVDPPCDSVTGGYVYRGLEFPSLHGFYVFSDYCRGDLWTLQENPGPTWELQARGSYPTWVSTFGTDQDGELFAAGIKDGIIYRVLPANPGLGQMKYRMPAYLPIETPNLQWFTQVNPLEGALEGTAFHYIAWLYLPIDWQVPWARQYSFSGDFPTGSMSMDWSAVTWMSSSGECIYGGAPEVDYKWRAFRGPQDTLPPELDRLGNLVNLRGGFWIPSSPTPLANAQVRLISGLIYDSDLDGTPDQYLCGPIGVSGVSVP